MKLPAFSSLASVLLLAPTIACAAVTTVQITATGTVCDFYQNCVDDLALTGSIQLTTVGGPDTFDSDVEASGGNWIQTALQLQWTGAVNGSYVSGVPGATTILNQASARNDSPYYFGIPAADVLYLQSHWHVETNGVGILKMAIVERLSTDSSWLSSLAFDTSVGLAPGADAINNLTFMSVVGTLIDGGGYQFSPDSVQGNFTLTSWTVSAVPEPANWALFSLGSGVLLWTRQRRRRLQD